MFPERACGANGASPPSRGVQVCEAESPVRSSASTHAPKRGRLSAGDATVGIASQAALSAGGGRHAALVWGSELAPARSPMASPVSDLVAVVAQPRACGRGSAPPLRGCGRARGIRRAEAGRRPFREPRAWPCEAVVLHPRGSGFRCRGPTSSARRAFDVCERGLDAVAIQLERAPLETKVAFIVAAISSACVCGRGNV